MLPHEDACLLLQAEEALEEADSGDEAEKPAVATKKDKKPLSKAAKSKAASKVGLRVAGDWYLPHELEGGRRGCSCANMTWVAVMPNCVSITAGLCRNQAVSPAMMGLPSGLDPHAHCNKESQHLCV